LTTAPAPTPASTSISVRRFPAVTLSRRHLPLTTAPAPTSRVPPSACGASLGVIAVRGLDPCEHLAQFLTRGLDRVGLLIGAELLELRGAGVLVVDEPLGEGAVLDIGQDRLHVLLHVGIDHPRPGDVVAVLGRVRDGPAL